MAHKQNFFLAILMVILLFSTGMLIISKKINILPFIIFNIFRYFTLVIILFFSLGMHKTEARDYECLGEVIGACQGAFIVDPSCEKACEDRQHHYYQCTKHAKCCCL
jgi:hypothetical protein